jgi:predicted CoA-binding protein
MGPGEGLSCAVTLNTALTPEEQRLYQDPRTIQRLLRGAKTIAIVGLSTDPQRASWFVANYLQKEGFRIVPVHPFATEILGERAYARLADVPVPVDVVDVFRPPSEALALARESIAIGARAFWMQLKLANLEAAALARDAGLDVVADRCIKMEHARYCGRLHWAGMNTEIISARKARLPHGGAA